MRNIISAIVLLASCTAASAGDSAAAEADDNIIGFGWGGKSCATWIGESGVKKVVMNSWILGFWTGLNAANTLSHRIGRSTDSEGVLGEVRLYCTSHPSEAILMATAEVYGQLATKEAGKK